MAYFSTNFGLIFFELWEVSRLRIFGVVRFWRLQMGWSKFVFGDVRFWRLQMGLIKNAFLALYAFDVCKWVDQNSFLALYAFDVCEWVRSKMRFWRCTLLTFANGFDRKFVFCIVRFWRLWMGLIKNVFLGVIDYFQMLFSSNIESCLPIFLIHLTNWF